MADIIDQKALGGIMDTDSSNEIIGANSHKYANNVRFRGNPKDGYRGEIVPGNTRIHNGHLPVTGTNTNNFAIFDAKKRRVISFNHNTLGKNGIYILNLSTLTWSRLIESFVDSATDILQFDLNYPIHSANIVYRPDSDGDLLCWTDGNKRPRCINMDTVQSLKPFTEAMINMAKDAPLRPPTINGFLSDATVNYNSVKNKLFRFAYRWQFKSLEKSSVSPISTVPMPDVTDPNLQADSTINNYISLTVYSPNLNDYKGIEILVQEWVAPGWSVWKRLDYIDRVEFNVPPNSSYVCKFYNNGVYPPAQVKPDDFSFYYVPDKANTQELLVGNSVVYGGVTDGYPKLDRSDVSVTITSAIVDGSSFVSPAFKFANDEWFGLVYFDERGKTNGVVTYITDSGIDPTDFAVTTPNYVDTTSFLPVKKPQITANIFHRPPSWAVSFQWVRAKRTPKFVHYVTTDYQTDNQYLYLGTQAFVELAAKNSFVSPYDFSPGDRVKILAKFDGDTISTAYSSIQDFPVLGVVQRTMSIGSTQGTFLKVPKPSSFPTPAYSRFMLIEIYTPIQQTEVSETAFFEWGQKYDIYESGGQRYHRGQTQDQTATLPATFVWTDGDVYQKKRAFYVAVPIEANTTYSYLFMMDANWNDYVKSAGNSNGRPWVVDENAATAYYPNMYRWGENYQEDTNINRLNVFYPLNFDTIDRSRGDILRMLLEDKVLYIYQTSGVCSAGVYAKWIKDNAGTNLLTTTSEIITKNNVRYLDGNYGLGTQPCSLVRGRNGVHYFVYPVTGDQLRRSGDGITPISQLYFGRYYISSLLTPYNKNYTRSDNAKSRILGAYDFLENDYIAITEAGSFGNAPNISAKAWSFNEERNGYGSFFDFKDAEFMLAAEDFLISFKNGHAWIHTNETNWANFFGIDYYPSIKLVFNKNVNLKQGFNATAYESNRIWCCPNIGDILTSMINPDSNLQQSSLLIEQDFQINENVRYAAFLRDISEGPQNIETGDFLKGTWIECNFTYRGNNFAWIFLPYVSPIESPKNY